MKTSLFLLLSFVGGLALAAADGLPDFLLHEAWSQSVLWVLMFVVGVGVGSARAGRARSLLSDYTRSRRLLLPSVTTSSSITAGVPAVNYRLPVAFSRTRRMAVPGFFPRPCPRNLPRTGSWRAAA